MRRCESRRVGLNKIIERLPQHLTQVYKKNQLNITISFEFKRFCEYAMLFSYGKKNWVHLQSESEPECEKYFSQ